MAIKQFLLPEDGEFVPLLSLEEEDQMLTEEFSDELPILPIKNTVLYPGVILPITAGRDKSISLLQDAQKGDKILAVITQQNNEAENPIQKDLYQVGTIAKLLKFLKMPDGSTTVILQGIRRFKLLELIDTEPYHKAKVQLLEDQKPKRKNKEFEGLMDSIRETAIKIIEENPNLPTEATFAIKNIEGDSFLVNFISSNLDLPLGEKQRILEYDSLKEKAIEVLKLLNIELQRLEIKNDIQSKVRNDLDQQQREYFLTQQIRTIQEELGVLSHDKEWEEMRIQAEKKQWSKEVGEHFDKELKRLQRMNPQVPEYSIQRNYLELFLDLPWNTYSVDHFDLNKAEKILNRDHYGLEDVKKRILEYLAVLKLKNNMKSPILCLYGPPGVGKTSLGKSVAEALGREYVRISLGGVHDEAEIRGHRKTYIGAMPGRIIQSLKKAGTSNPVFVLDEIDKLGNGVHGDPSSALLEVLDPEQNNSFYDNYLEQGYDLSKVMFIATANSLASIPSPLRDRMEIIDISGYTLEEKIKIAQKHLLPKQWEEHGLKGKKMPTISKPVWNFIVGGYTRESGVRGLDKTLAKITRYFALQYAKELEDIPTEITQELTEKILGPARPLDLYENLKVPGVVTGLAWTRVGGDILFIESILSAGNGKLSITGNLGNVMKESATIALEYIKSHHAYFGISPEKLKESNIHIHVPEGATPKDGPSAGVTMLTSMVSSYTGKKVKPKLAMTGEITLRGKVLPVGGIKEKILAAKRAGIKEILLSADNQKDINEIKEEYLKGLKFHYVKEMKEVIEIAIPQLIKK